MGSYLIDSNVVSHYLSGKLPASAIEFINNIIDEGAVLSVITRIELLGFNAPKSDALLFSEFINDCQVIDLSEAIVLKTIALRKLRSIKIPDAIIAATALVGELTLLTNNTKDFSNISGLTVLDPHTL